MALFQQIGTMLEEETLRKLSQGHGNVEEPGTPAHDNFQKLLTQAGPSLLKDVFGSVAANLDSTQYALHITPGAAGPNPLGPLGPGERTAVASTLLSHLIGDGLDPEELLGKAAGLTTVDPNQMDAGQVAALAGYVQRNHPSLFGMTVAELVQRNPGVINRLLGSAGLASAASALATHFLGQR
ncbi:MAG TPA: hypothetical protein VFC78_12795 [Tepidisphaeraceae bacterium]|nr:hypothetical protein [Tepidisphaeraceae bacterium]